LEKLEKLFNYEFKVVFYQVTELSSNSGDSGGFRKMIMIEVEVVAVVEDKVGCHK
jgi:hypothetical protein